jgi:hypothetical protein
LITCLDPRTDPSAFLELKLGDAMVVRNAGGRVSADVLKDLAYIGYLARTLVPGGPQHNRLNHWPISQELNQHSDVIGTRWARTA